MYPPGLRDRPTISANLMSNLDLESGAPAEPAMATDATWDESPAYAILLTDNGGAVLHTKKSLHLALVSSTEAEGAGAAKGSEAIETYLEILRAQRRLPDDGIQLFTDNKAMVASGVGNASRMRHCLRRYNVLMQRVQRKQVQIGFVPDPLNPSDYLTKFIDKRKVDQSDDYATNRKNAVTPKRI